MITSALPYVHGTPHLGNFVGSILPADVYSRYLKLKGENAVYVCGSDQHGTPIELSAYRKGIPVKKLAQENHEKTKSLFLEYNCLFDYYGYTNSKENEKTTKEIFLQLYKNNYINEKTEKQAYCENCKKFLADRWIEGTCPYCKGLGRGDQCDDCGKLLTPIELIRAYCVECHQQGIIFKETKNLYLDLTKFEKQLREWLLTKENWPSNAKNTALSLVNQGLVERAITRDIKWGFKVPVKGFEDKVIYVWFDAPIGYVSFTKEFFAKKKKSNEWKKFWQNENSKIVQFLGKDNIIFHTIIFPATLIGTKQNYHLADCIASCNFLILKSLKFSKSRGIGLNLETALSIREADYWRYSLISQYPAFKDSEFSLELFQSIVNEQLADTIGNLIQRATIFLEKNFESKIPKPDEASFDETDKELIKTIQEQPLKIELEFEKIMNLKEALQECYAFAKTGNEYLQKKAPWQSIKTNRQEAANTLYLLSNLLYSLSICFWPIIPKTSEKILSAFGEKKSVLKIGWEKSTQLNLKAGQKIIPTEPLFRKIDSKELIELKTRFE